MGSTLRRAGRINQQVYNKPNKQFFLRRFGSCYQQSQSDKRLIVETDRFYQAIFL